MTRRAAPHAPRRRPFCAGSQDYTIKTGWLTTAEGNKYYFDADGCRVSGKWVQIDGKWYYFDTDGKLAVSTIIDGYEVDADGAWKE